MYADYEAWREGQGGYLEEMLFGDPGQSREMMRQAEAYARELGLRSEPQPYLSWGAGERKSLRFSAESGVDQSFQTAHRKGEETLQMDLLMESPGATLANGIIQALLERDESESAQLLARLHEVDPGHHQLGGFEYLLDAFRRPASRDDLAGELRYLQQELSPMAEEILGASARHFLAPHWQRLCQLLAGTGFDPRHPERHASYAATQAEDWRQVKVCVEAEPHWRDQPRLLQRHARACSRLHQDLQALSSWFILYWNFPGQAASCFSAEGNSEWRQAWQRFLDLEPELPDEDFPAWLLIDRPGLAKRLQTEGLLEAFQPPEDFRLIAELAQAGTDETGPDVLALRKRLQQTNPGLFDCYMQFY